LFASSNPPHGLRPGRHLPARGFLFPRLLTMLDRSSIIGGMNRIPFDKRCAVVRCLVDGCSIRATVRITGVSKNAIQRLTRALGEAVLEYQSNVQPDLQAGSGG
jgi:hypothetical protein